MTTDQPRFVLELENLDPEHSRVVYAPDGHIQAIYMWAEPVDDPTQVVDLTGWEEIGYITDTPPALGTPQE